MQLVSISEESPNGVARLLHTVLAEKLEEAPWKAKVVDSLGRRVVRLEVPDRGEAATVEAGFGELGVRSESDEAPDVTISLDMKALPLILSVPLGPGRLPALWKGGGKALVKALLGRKVRVKGLFAHPVVVVRVLQILGVPPGTA